MTFGDAPNHEPPATQQPMRFKRTDRVRRTGGLKPARAAGEGRQQQLVGFDDEDAEPPQ